MQVAVPPSLEPTKALPLSIQFNLEQEEEGRIPFLDGLVERESRAKLPPQSIKHQCITIGAAL